MLYLDSDGVCSVLPTHLVLGTVTKVTLPRPSAQGHWMYILCSTSKLRTHPIHRSTYGQTHALYCSKQSATLDSRVYGLVCIYYVAVLLRNKPIAPHARFLPLPTPVPPSLHSTDYLLSTMYMITFETTKPYPSRFSVPYPIIYLLRKYSIPANSHPPYQRLDSLPRHTSTSHLRKSSHHNPVFLCKTFSANLLKR